VLGVVEVDVRDRGHAAVPGMGRVEPAAKPDLDDREVNAGIREVAERERGEELELRRRAVAPGDPVCDRQARPDEAREIGGGDGVAGDADPLAIAHQVWLRRLPGTIPGSREAGADERNDAALAVRPADERAADPLLGVPKRRQQGPGPSQAQPDPEAPACFQRDDRLGEGSRQVVGHRPGHRSRSSS
jgi:hypothetical protein